MRILFLSAVLFIFSCKNEPPSVSLESERPLQFEDTILLIQNNQCKNEDKTDCIVVDFKYIIASHGNPKVRKTINDYIESTLKKMFSDSPNNDISKQSIAELANQFLKKPRVPHQEDTDIKFPLQNLGTAKVLHQNDEIVFISLKNYFGRARGEYYTIHKNFDKKTGQFITPNDLFEDKNQLSPFFEADIRKVMHLEPHESIRHTFKYEGEHFPVNNNMGILKDTLIFTYPPYEVADYATGGVDIFVYKNDIQHLLKKQSKQLF